jgi:hypothetical protein
MMVTMMLLVLNPRALNMANSNVFSSVSDIMSEYINSPEIMDKKNMMVFMRESINVTSILIESSDAFRGTEIVILESNDKAFMRSLPAALRCLFIFGLPEPYMEI